MIFLALSYRSLSHMTGFSSSFFRIFSSCERRLVTVRSNRIFLSFLGCFHRQNKVQSFSIQTNFALSILEYSHIQSSAGSNRSPSFHSGFVHNDQPVRENIPGIRSRSKSNTLPRFQSSTFSTVLPKGKAVIAVEQMNGGNLGRIFFLERDPIPRIFSLTG